MYQQHQHHHHLPPGQSGAYYSSPDSAAATTASQAQLHQSYLIHPNHHYHHYPLSSDSSLNESSSFIASSAQRLNSMFQKCCCSKKCIFISCLMLILMIFIFVIGLSAYLNFLINLNKTNLIPLSGRLKVNSEGDLFNDLLANKTTKEFLHKQLQYETILRGALDKSLMRTYPLHLIKLEVYSFKPGSLWCYFRLFLNKKSLMQDLQLMKRKSLDENMDKLFLPRLTQQTLHSGFEQLLTDFSGAARSTSGDRPESLRRNQRASAPQQAQPTAQQQNAKSFDDQISRLMPIIENIDLSTIQVTAEFDMLAMINSQAAMSENLRALQPILATTTTPSPSSTATIMVATGPKMSDFDLLQPSSQPDSVKPAKQPPAIELSSSGSASDEISVSTKRFTLHDYRENATRPPTSAKPTTTNQESLFLLNQQQKKPALSSQKPQSSQTLKELASAPSKSGSDVESGEKVIKLVSGQPVVSQNPNIFASSQPANVTSNQNAGQSSPARNITTLFAPLTKLDQLANRPKSVNESAAIMQMVAPYQKIEYSSVMVPQQQQSVQRANETQASQRLQKSSNTSAASIQELWNNALGKKNATVIMPNDQRPSGQLADSANNNKRLITVTTIGQPSANNNNDQSTNLQKVSLLSSDISSTIRAQMQQANANVAATTQPTPTTTGSSPKPKVSPHLRQGGSIISTNNNPARNSAPEQPTSTTSAIVLNRDRDFLQLANKNINQGQDNNNSTSSQQQATRKLSTASAQPNRSASSSTSAKQTPNNKKVSLQRNGNNSTSTDKPRNSNKQQVAKQQQNKLDQQRQQSSIVANDQSVRSSNQTNGIGNNQNGTLINSKGIRIVDDFLAHIDPKLLLLASSNRTNLSSSRGKNRTQEPFNFNADQMLIPTLPTTIELTRQTTASLPLRSSTPSFVSNLDFTTTTPSSSQPSTTTELPFQVAELPVSILGQTNKPGTSNFSNQWRPLSRDNNNGSSTANRAKPANSLSIILGSERLPATLNNPSSQLGSRSPFAMSTSILENPQLMGNKPAAASRTANSQRQTGSQRLSNTYHVSNSASAAAAGQRSNEFESRRVSRMRQNNGPANHESDLNQSSLESSSSSSTFATTSSSTVVATSGATSSSSLFSSTPSSAEPTTNTRFVDDFMITTDRSLANGLNPTTASLDSSAEIDPALARLRSSALSFVSQPRRTRGPFVFETLKSQAADNPFAELATTISGGASRLERSSSVQPEVDSKLLIRKKLFVGDDSGDALAPSATTSNPLIEPLPGMMHAEEEISLDDKQLDHFGNRRSFLARHRVNETAAAAAPGNRCQYYGCKAKGLINFVCLNYTQLCDDIIDCQDESDELDCVSLLQHDFNTNKLSFSNGGGIIYLNRKGSLAPMCIDYFGTTTVLSSSLSPPAQMIAPQNQDMNLNLIKKQQELIRQINTIGQYACSLQSFSRLVSVKINHHNLIDPMNLIKSSRLYHRLSIIDGMEKQHDQGYDSSYGSYKSGTSDHEVEISTSSECPSQRTVFVKCGGFECGQDSFSVIDQNNNMMAKKAGIIINDFPWLVKLYWRNSLACHGYLIDDLWLITSSECFNNRTLSDWMAEISYEHYGNDDYQSIESHRRNIKDILMPPHRNHNNVKSSIVLVKLEKPVRFSPLNRPICLPPSTSNASNGGGGSSSSSSMNNNRLAIFGFDPDRSYKDCVTATIPLATDRQLPTQDLILRKVKVNRLATDCLLDDSSSALDPSEMDELRRSLLCVSDDSQLSPSNLVRDYGDSSTHVLICSTAQQTSRLRSKWTVVGIENKVQHLKLANANNKQLFTAVSSQLDWIVDTTNPKSFPNLFSSESQQNQACNRFRCSSGECLSFSRICDGLYDCSSQEDEKDCHK